MNKTFCKISNFFSKKYYLLPSLYGRGLGVGLLLLACSSSYAQTALYPDAFPLGDVTLLDGPLKHARDLNVNVLLQYDVDRILDPYRKEAGLPEKAKGFPNWDGLDGHIGGHYLTALAFNAATGDKKCEERMLYMIKELKECAADQ